MAFMARCHRDLWVTQPLINHHFLETVSNLQKDLPTRSINFARDYKDVFWIWQDANWHHLRWMDGCLASSQLTEGLISFYNTSLKSTVKHEYPESQSFSYEEHSPRPAVARSIGLQFPQSTTSHEAVCQLTVLHLLGTNAQTLGGGRRRRC